MSGHVKERTASSYISCLDNAVRVCINEKIDSEADSIYSYTTVHDVSTVIGLLNDDEDFFKENERRHHSLTSALNLYLKYVQNR